MSLFLPGEVPSLKNSKVAFIQDGRQKVLPSKFCQAYMRDKKGYGVAYWRIWREMTEGKPYPLTIEFLFIRRTKQRFDYNNISQVLLDLMKKWEWLPDDDMDHVIPDFSKGYVVDKENPGVFITVK